MSQCRDCKHWEPPEANERQGPVWRGLGVCGATRPIWEMSEYSHDIGGDKFTAEGESKRSFVKDGSNYMAALLCRPDFGCVEFEERPNAEAVAETMRK